MTQVFISTGCFIDIFQNLFLSNQCGSLIIRNIHPYYSYIKLVKSFRFHHPKTETYTSEVSSTAVHPEIRAKQIKDWQQQIQDQEGSQTIQAD